MTIAIWGSAAAVFALFIAACLTLTPTFGREPAGAHHKPSRRQREQARDEAWLRDVEEIGGDLRMGTMPGPLMPLPPEAKSEGTSFGAESYTPAPEMQVSLQVEDPHDVASDEQAADAYVGDLGPAELPEPEPPLFDTSADHWREDTLLGIPAVTDA